MSESDCGFEAHPPYIPLRLKAKKGRGAVSNRQGRYETLTREEIDDGWSYPQATMVDAADTSERKLARSATGGRDSVENRNHRGACQVDPEPQPVAGCSFRRLSQPLPGLRTRLHLLLRPPHAQLSGPVARPGFREPDFRQGQCT